jgi:hypothetical protein
MKDKKSVSYSFFIFCHCCIYSLSFTGSSLLHNCHCMSQQLMQSFKHFAHLLLTE